MPCDVVCFLRSYGTQLIFEQMHISSICILFFLGALWVVVGQVVLPHNSHIHGFADPDSCFSFDDFLSKPLVCTVVCLAQIESPLVGYRRHIVIPFVGCSCLVCTSNWMHAHADFNRTLERTANTDIDAHRAADKMRHAIPCTIPVSQTQTTP